MSANFLCGICRLFLWVVPFSTPSSGLGGCFCTCTVLFIGFCLGGLPAYLQVTPWSLLFLGCLGLISLVVLVYSWFYLVLDSYLRFYFIFIFLFIFSMALFVLSDSPLLLLLCWDLLGASSFLLVVYYWSADSISGALSTLFTGRLGDLLLLTLVAGLLFCESVPASTCFGTLLSFALLGASFSKSAQFPFSGWLPRAMSAPTPVSALVHSSTLVTAGLFLLFLCSSVPGSVCPFAWVLCVVSLVFSGVLALVEEDFNKLVALSTLSQISFCVLAIVSGAILGGYYHLLGQAFVNSCLFLQVGAFIYFLTGQQDFRGGALPAHFLSLLVLGVCLLSLGGLIFSSISFTKELVLSHLGGLSSGFLFLVVFLTYLYSWRLWAGGSSLFRGTIYYSSPSCLSFSSLFLLIPLLSFLSWVLGSWGLSSALHSGSVSLYPLYCIFFGCFFSSLSYRAASSLLSGGFLGSYVLSLLASLFPSVFLLESFLAKAVLDLFAGFGTLRSWGLTLSFGGSAPLLLGATFLLFLISPDSFEDTCLEQKVVGHLLVYLFCFPPWGSHWFSGAICLFCCCLRLVGFFTGIRFVL